MRAGKMPEKSEYFPGDPCPEGCSGVIGVTTTVRTVATVTRYLKCKRCGFLPENKLVEVIHIS